MAQFMLETFIVPTRSVATQTERAPDTNHARHAVSSRQQEIPQTSTPDTAPSATRWLMLSSTHKAFKVTGARFATAIVHPHNTVLCAHSSLELTDFTVVMDYEAF